MSEARSLREALTVVSSVQPDIVVSEVDLPDGNGMDLCRRLVDRQSSLRALLLSERTDQDTLLEAASSGASGLVSRRLPAMHMVAAVRKVARCRDAARRRERKPAGAIGAERSSRIEEALHATQTDFLDLVCAQAPVDAGSGH